MSVCPICCGAKKVRLPVREPVSAYDPMRTPSVGTMREYACPECTYKVPVDQVAIVDSRVLVGAIELDTSKAGADLVRHVENAAIYKLMLALVSGGYIKVARAPLVGSVHAYPFTATIGVVSKSAVATMEARIAERQDLVAHAVEGEAVRQLHEWGSNRGTQNISKAMARQIIGDAVRVVIERWTKWRAEQAAAATGATL